MKAKEYKESVFFRLTEFFEGEFSNRELLSLFAIGVGGLILCWISLFFAPDFLIEMVGRIVDLEERVVFWLLFFPFLFGATAGFAIFKFLFRRGDTAIVAGDEFMSGFAENLRRANLRRVFYASIAVGAVNAILIFFASG